MKTRIFDHLPAGFREKALVYAQTFEFACLLENRYQGDYPFGGFRNLLAGGSSEGAVDKPTVSKLRKIQTDKWLFGFLGYPVSEELLDIDLKKSPGLCFPDAILFEADWVLEWIAGGRISIVAEDPDLVYRQICYAQEYQPKGIHAGAITQISTKAHYFDQVKAVHNLIRNGDVYELNLCRFFELETALNGLDVYTRLAQKSPMPFAGWFCGKGYEIASASPERFLKKTGAKILSQPIKGSAPRFKDPEADLFSRDQLLLSEKERAENLMIVDLVRNDLCRIAVPGTTSVEEIFGIYSFPNIHQMISSVSAFTPTGAHYSDAIASAFPMGSMTGAPKLEAVKQIDRLENYPRGAFSGALGYITPDQDFDFNVLIRSVFMNHNQQKSGFAVGSAITIDAEAEAEWAEGNHKAKAILEILSE